MLPCLVDTFSVKQLSGRIQPRQWIELCNFGAPSPLDFWNFVVWGLGFGVSGLVSEVCSLEFGGCFGVWGLHCCQGSLVLFFVFPLSFPLSFHFFGKGRKWKEEKGKRRKEGKGGSRRGRENEGGGREEKTREIFASGVLPVSPGFLCNLVGNRPKMWRQLPDLRAEKKAQNPVTSLAVMVFSVPTEYSQTQKSMKLSGVIRANRCESIRANRVIRANRKSEWFVRTDLTLYKNRGSTANDSRESIRANRVANRPGH